MLKGMAKKIIGAMASGGAGRGGQRAAGGRDGMEQPETLAELRRRSVAEAVSRPLDVRALGRMRPPSMDQESIDRDARIAEILGGVEQTGQIAAGRDANPDARAEAFERIRRARGY